MKNLLNILKKKTSLTYQSNLPLNVVRILEWSAAAGRNCGNERDADVSFVPGRRKKLNLKKIIKKGENVEFW
jgi:hypothetical protein